MDCRSLFVSLDFCAPLVGPRVHARRDSTISEGLNPSWLDRSLFPFTSRVLDIDGNTIRYIDEGSGPTLLLLHGNPTWSFLYRHILRKLSPHFRCIALDYPGFGLSTAKPEYAFLPREHSDIVEKLVDHLGLKNLRSWCRIGAAQSISVSPDVGLSWCIRSSWATPLHGQRKDRKACPPSPRSLVAVSLGFLLLDTTLWRNG